MSRFDNINLFLPLHHRSTYLPQTPKLPAPCPNTKKSNFPDIPMSGCRISGPPTRIPLECCQVAIDSLGNNLPTRYDDGESKSCLATACGSKSLDFAMGSHSRASYKAPGISMWLAISQNCGETWCCENVMPPKPQSIGQADVGRIPTCCFFMEEIDSSKFVRCQ